MIESIKEYYYSLDFLSVLLLLFPFPSSLISPSTFTKRGMVTGVATTVEVDVGALFS